MILIVYLFIIFSWIFFKDRGEKGKNLYILSSVILLILLTGLRNEVIFGDTFRYVYRYKEFEFLSINEIEDLNSKDTGFYIFSSFIGWLFNYNYTLWLLLISSIFFWPLGLIIKKFSTNPMISWACFFFIGLFYFSMAGMRQIMSMGILLIGFLYLIKRKYLIFLLCVIIASQLHIVSWIFLVVLPLYKYQINFTNKSLLIYFFLLIIALIMGTPILQSLLLSLPDIRFATYANSMNGATYTYFIQQLILIIPILLSLDYKRIDKLTSIFLHLSMISLICVSLSVVVAESFRLSMYFSWALIIIFPNMLQSSFRKSPILQPIFVSLITIYLLFINGTLLSQYYFWFEDTSDIATGLFMNSDLYWL